MSSLTTGSKIVFYIYFLNERHGSSSRAVACLNEAVLVRSKVWVAKGENRIFTTVPSIRFNLHACGSLAESACIPAKYEGPPIPLRPLQKQDGVIPVKAARMVPLVDLSLKVQSRDFH